MSFSGAKPSVFPISNDGGNNRISNTQLLAKPRESKLVIVPGSWTTGNGTILAAKFIPPPRLG
jgi:hypothetical protein